MPTSKTADAVCALVCDLRFSRLMRSGETLSSVLDEERLKGLAKQSTRLTRAPPETQSRLARLCELRKIVFPEKK